MSKGEKKWCPPKPAKLACGAVFRVDADRWSFCNLDHGHTEVHADHHGNRWSTAMPSRRNVWPWEQHQEEETT